MGEVLTEAKIEQFSYMADGPRAQRLWDVRIPGLAVQVYPSQAKRWIFRYRFQGKQHFITIGPVAGVRSELRANLEKARVTAWRMIQQIDEGIDPRIERQAKQSKTAEV